MAPDTRAHGPIDLVGAVAFALGLALLIGAVLVAAAPVHQSNSVFAVSECASFDSADSQRCLVERGTFLPGVGTLMPLSSPVVVVSDCGRVFGEFLNTGSPCHDEMASPVLRAGLLLVGAVALLVSAGATLITTHQRDPLPFWISLPLIGLPVAIILLLAFGLFYSRQYACCGGD